MGFLHVTIAMACSDGTVISHVEINDNQTKQISILDKQIVQLEKYILQFGTNTFCHFEQIHKYILQFETNTFRSGLVCVTRFYDVLFPCMEYMTDGGRGVKHEKWPISSFGQSVTSGRDASASERGVSGCPSVSTTFWTGNGRRKR